jgi:hypothetical protein
MDSQEKYFSGCREPQQEGDNLDSPHAETIASECLPTTEDELKPAATTTTPKTTAHAAHYSCICNWENCQDMQQKLSADHVWNKTPFQFKLGKETAGRTSRIKSLSFRAGVFKHLNTPQDKQLTCKASFCIAYHHFAILLLQQYTGNRTTFLSRENVLGLDKDGTLHSNTGYSDQSCLVSALMRSVVGESLSTDEDEKYKNKYVQVPMVSSKEVHDTVVLFTSPRYERNTGVVDITPKKLNSTPKAKRLLLTLDDASPSKRQKMLVEPTDKYKSTKAIHMSLISEYAECNKSKSSNSMFENSELVQRAVNDISFMSQKKEDFPTAYEPQKDAIFHTCLTHPQPENCVGFKILSYYTERVECDTCKQNTLYKQRHAQRKEIDTGKRESHSSRVPIAHLSPQGMDRRLKNVITEKKNQQKKIKRLQLKLKPPKEQEMVAINSDEVKSVLKEAFDHILIEKDRVTLKKLIVKTLVESELDDGNNNNMDSKEVDMFTSRVCTLLEAESKKLSGDNRQVRYDYRIKRLALSHFLEFGVSGYQRLLMKFWREKLSC